MTEWPKPTPTSWPDSNPAAQAWPNPTPSSPYDGLTENQLLLKRVKELFHYLTLDYLNG